MTISELIEELEYWRDMMMGEDPEVVVNTPPCSYKIEGIQPVKGIKSPKAVGIIFN